jgi:hypothetical protein
MKNSFIFSVCAVLSLGVVTSCNDGNTGANITSQYVDYRDGENKFTVIAIQKEGMDEQDAKKAAMNRAAELTKTNGFRYFRLKKEYTTTILHTDPTEDVYRFPGNLYQEDIQEQGFNRDRIYERQGIGAQSYPAYRVEFECYDKNPGRGAYDACDYVECSDNK